jgi:hypothetical protein
MSLACFFTLVVVPSASDLDSTFVDALPSGVFVSTVVELASSAYAGTSAKESSPREIDSVFKDRNIISSIAAVRLAFN